MMIAVQSLRKGGGGGGWRGREAECKRKKGDRYERGENYRRGGETGRQGDRETKVCYWGY